MYMRTFYKIMNTHFDPFSLLPALLFRGLLLPLNINDYSSFECINSNSNMI